MPKASTTPKVRFNLKNFIDKDKEQQFIAKFRYFKGDDTKSTLLKYYTGIKIYTHAWSGEKSQIKKVQGGVSKNIFDRNELNIKLFQIEQIILAIYKENKSIDPSAFKTEIDYRLGRKKRPKPKGKDEKTFIEFIETEIEKQKINVDGRKGGQTWQKYQSILKRLKTYSNESGYTIEYDSITESFKDDFILWLEKKKLSQNTISKEVETIKALLKRSRRFHNNTYYTDPDFKVSRITTTEHYPTLKELKHLYNFKFEDDTIQQVVDLYLISAFGGGLRISDILSLTKENEITIDNNQVLQVFTFKNRYTKADNEVVIPFTPQLRILIDKYEWKLPRLSEQHINRTLKVAFEICGLDRAEPVKTGVKGVKPENKKLYEVVHFHNARNAYIDYMMNDLEVSAERLRKITGQSLKVLLAYERGDKKKNALKVAENISKKLAFDVIKNSAL